MSTRSILAISLLSGLLGGVVSHFALAPTAFAQQPAPNPAPVTREIRAQSFAVVDNHDNVVGTITSSGASPDLQRTIVIRDRFGKELWRGAGPIIRPLSDR